MVICADTSFLFGIYGYDAHTPRALSWVQTQRTWITLTVLNEFELANSLRFSEFRKAIRVGEAATYWAQFEADKAAGRLVVPPCNLAHLVEEAKRLSATSTLHSGHRAFDILHVAGALTLGAQTFLTFDVRQKNLAKSEGLSVPF